MVGSFIYFHLVVWSQFALDSYPHPHPKIDHLVEKIGKVVNQENLAILSHFSGKTLEKVANWAKLAVPSHFEPLRWEKIGKAVNQAKLAESF